MGLVFFLVLFTASRSRVFGATRSEMNAGIRFHCRVCEAEMGSLGWKIDFLQPLVFFHVVLYKCA